VPAAGRRATCVPYFKRSTHTHTSLGNESLKRAHGPLSGDELRIFVPGLWTCTSRTFAWRCALASHNTLQVRCVRSQRCA